MAVIGALLKKEENLWFRGQASLDWELTPSALRYSTKEDRKRALDTIKEFMKIAEIKINSKPSKTEYLKWAQLAQHYGVPTRLLDWTENAIYALFFACLPVSNIHKAELSNDGAVYFFNPDDITPYKSDTDDKINKRYCNLGPKENSRGAKTIAIDPVINSERLLLQRGKFTLHGNFKFGIDRFEVPSIAAIPIYGEFKEGVQNELLKIGVDEMTMFPEIEYAVKALIRRRNLMSE